MNLDLLSEHIEMVPVLLNRFFVVKTKQNVTETVRFHIFLSIRVDFLFDMTHVNLSVVLLNELILVSRNWSASLSCLWIERIHRFRQDRFSCGLDYSFCLEIRLALLIYKIWHYWFLLLQQGLVLFLLYHRSVPLMFRVLLALCAFTTYA